MAEGGNPDKSNLIAPELRRQPLTHPEMENLARAQLKIADGIHVTHTELGKVIDLYELSFR